MVLGVCPRKSCILFLLHGMQVPVAEHSSKSEVVRAGWLSASACWSLTQHLSKTRQDKTSVPAGKADQVSELDVSPADQLADNRHDQPEHDPASYEEAAERLQPECE